MKPSGRKSINHMFLVQQAHSIPISLGDMNGDSACSGGGDNEQQQQQLRDDAADTLLKAHMQSQGIMVVINGPTIRFSFPLQRRHCRLADSSCCSNNPHPSRASCVCGCASQHIWLQMPLRIPIAHNDSRKDNIILQLRGTRPDE